jgi:hypothetical protein
MPKVIRGRAGREQRREDLLESYTAALAPMLVKQLRVAPDARMMHLGSPGAVLIAETFAPALETGELVVVVYSYDEMEETRAALAGLGNAEVINEIEDVDPDEPPYNVMTSIVPYHLGYNYVNDLLASGLRLLTSDGLLYLAGDRQHGFERHLEHLAGVGSRITPVVQVGTLRIVTASKPGPRGGLRRSSSTS